MTNGKTLMIKVRKDSIVEEVKIKIEQREGIPRHLQKLKLGTKYLNNEHKLNTI